MTAAAGIDVTQVFVEWVTHAIGDYSFAELVRLAAQDAGDGWVDAEKVHDAFPTVGFTYVQFCLRETPHICRHTIGERKYRVHSALVCSEECDEKFAHTPDRPAVPSRACPSCGIHAPLSLQSCDFCDEPLKEAA